MACGGHSDRKSRNFDEDPFITSPVHPVVGGVPSVYNNLCRHLGDTAAVLRNGPRRCCRRSFVGCRTAVPDPPHPPLRFRSGKGLPKAFSTAARYFGDHLVNRALVRARVPPRRRGFPARRGMYRNPVFGLPRRARLPPSRGVLYIYPCRRGLRRRPSRPDGNAPKLALPKDAAVIAVSRFTRDHGSGPGVEPERVHRIASH
jgi:hypothetical protein